MYTRTVSNILIIIIITNRVVSHDKLTNILYYSNACLSAISNVRTPVYTTCLGSSDFMHSLCDCEKSPQLQPFPAEDVLRSRLRGRAFSASGALACDLHKAGTLEPRRCWGSRGGVPCRRRIHASTRSQTPLAAGVLWPVYEYYQFMNRVARS
jgi:hypothetical protein